MKYIAPTRPLRWRVLLLLGPSRPVRLRRPLEAATRTAAVVLIRALRSRAFPGDVFYLTRAARARGQLSDELAAVADRAPIIETQAGDVSPTSRRTSSRHRRQIFLGPTFLLGRAPAINVASRLARRRQRAEQAMKSVAGRLKLDLASTARCRRSRSSAPSSTRPRSASWLARAVVGPSTSRSTSRGRSRAGRRPVGRRAGLPRRDSVTDVRASRRPASTLRAEKTSTIDPLDRALPTMSSQAPLGRRGVLEGLRVRSTRSSPRA